MNVTTARKILRLGLNTGNQAWGDDECDIAIIAALRYANEEMGGLKRRTSTQVTVAGTTTVNLTAATNASDFDPSLLKTLRISSGGTTAYEPLHHKHVNLVQRRLHDDTARQQREMIGFQTAAIGRLYPTPDAVYTITFTWSSDIMEDLSSWTIGAGDGTSITINLPDRVMYPIIMFGATAMLTRAWPRNKSQMNNMNEFKEWIARQDGNYGVDSGADEIEPIDF